MDIFAAIFLMIIGSVALYDWYRHYEPLERTGDIRVDDDDEDLARYRLKYMGYAAIAFGVLIILRML